MGMSKTDIFFVTVSGALLLFIFGVVAPWKAEQDRIQQQIQALKKVTVEDKTVVAEEAKKRFKAEFHGEFNGGFGNNPRHIFVITDTNTNIEYLAITGCGTTEIRVKKENDRNITKEE